MHNESLSEWRKNHIDHEISHWSIAEKHWYHILSAHEVIMTTIESLKYFLWGNMIQNPHFATHWFLNITAEIHTVSTHHCSTIWFILNSSPPSQPVCSGAHELTTAAVAWVQPEQPHWDGAAGPVPETREATALQRQAAPTQRN